MTEAEAREELTEMYQEKHDDLVRMYKSRAGANDVEDLVQEGFYRALYYIKSFNPKLVSMDRWLSGILENCLRDLLNEKRGGSSLRIRSKPICLSCRYAQDMACHLQGRECMNLKRSFGLSILSI